MYYKMLNRNIIIEQVYDCVLRKRKIKSDFNVLYVDRTGTNV